MAKNIEEVIKGFRNSHYGKDLIVREVERDKSHSYHHITGQGYSLTLWQEGIDGTRDDLVLGSLEVPTPGLGLGTFVIETLALYGEKAGFARLNVNKPDNLNFLNSRGFIPHEIDPNTYYRVLR